LKSFLIAIIIILTAWAVNFFQDDLFSASAVSGRQQDMLVKAGDECLQIADKATAHIIPTLEFQRLELAGRKSNVIKRCMEDRSYYQSPAWLKYAEPIARQRASVQHISEDEALENLRREDMLIFEPRRNQPLFWQYIKKPASQ